MAFKQGVGFELIPTAAWERRSLQRWPRLGALLFALLQKIQYFEPYFGKEPIFQEVVLDRQEAVRQLIETADFQLRLVGYRPKQILIGMPQFQKMLASKDAFEFLRPILFKLDVPVSQQQPSYGYGRGIEMLGIEIQVIPWMDGVLVL